jgi:hypothetical protein
MKKISFRLPSENLVQILPESGSALDLDPDPHSSKMLDLNPYPDPQYNQCGSETLLRTVVL